MRLLAKLNILLHEVIEYTTFKSKLIEEYFMDISLPYYRINIQNSMLILIVYEYLQILITSMFSKIIVMSLIGQGVALIILLVNLILIKIIIRCELLIFTTLLSILGVLIYGVIITTPMTTRIEVNYTPMIQIIFILFAFIPVKFSTSLLIYVLLGIYMIARSFLRFQILESRQKDPLTQFYSKNSSPALHLHVNNFLIGQAVLWGLSLINSFYVFNANRIWRKAAFLTLGESVLAKQRSRQAMEGQLRWIEAVMPGVVKDEYWAHTADIKADKWVYIQTFDNVSILFADIVGFTIMSSNKTAPQVVTLLNDLFNRFDELCILTNCEKLGTLGDCYYCVAGCPVPRSDHAVSCVEMGLGMCRIIKQFNGVYHESVNMRVGIHTGRVNAAIIGKIRFRFDVYSNDVIIANNMESSGQPGRVHISETVYYHIKHTYTVEPGVDLEIKREEGHGIAGMLLKKHAIKTYFVDPKSAHFEQEVVNFGERKMFHVFNLQNDRKISSTESDTDYSSYFSSSSTSEITSEGDSPQDDLIFIENLKFDPDQQVNSMNNPPINEITLIFSDSELEWHYQCHTIDHVQKFTLYSAKMSPFLESLMGLICTVINFCAVVIFFGTKIFVRNNILLIFINFGLFICIVIIEFWKSQTYQSLLTNKYELLFFNLISTQLYKSIICIYIMLCPTFLSFFLAYDCELFANSYYYQSSFFSLILFSMFSGLLFIAVNLAVKFLALLFNFLIVIYILCIDHCDNMQALPYFPSFGTCSNNYKIDLQFYDKERNYNFLFQFCFSLFVMLIMIRERERNIRNWFYVSREGDICREEALQQMYSSRDLLHNIIPKYVFDYISMNANSDEGTFNYALSISNAGVVFACISNFFSKYYREDYKGGGNALKLLHQIISKFDDLLLGNDYKDVEKIKTINDCYMVAAGLNTTEVERNTNKLQHLEELMYYVFEMKTTLNYFNEKYIIGTDKFEIKIGYNCGPITAGIIGSTKPMYDIWGDTVNVSSRMYSTGAPGIVQVPHYVANRLSHMFEFKYRGVIFVKGKGDMDTYICVNPIDRSI